MVLTRTAYTGKAEGLNMARVKLTAGRIRDFECPTGGQAFLWDTDAPGLGVRATAGAKAFIFQSRLNGRALRITIGDVRVWGIDESRNAEGAVVTPGARQEARRLQALIDQGTDPRHDKAEKLAVMEAKREKAQTAELTVGDVWKVYIEARTPKWGERHLRNHMAMTQAGGAPRKRGRRPGEADTVQPGPLHPLLSMRLRELDAKAVRAWLEPLAQRAPTTAAQTYRALRAFIAWCVESEQYNLLTHADACTRRMAGDVLPKPKPKTDCLQREQIAPWFEKVRALTNPVQSAYLQTLLLTGARREELAGLRWIDVDFQWKSMTIRDKVEGERTIPLTPYVASLLRDLKARNEAPPAKPQKLRTADNDVAVEPWKPSQWVFSSPTAASGRLQEPRIAHNKALTAAGLPALSLHGLRRSFGTLCEWVEVPAGIVAQIMGHKPSALAEKHYRVRPLDMLRQWHTKIEGWILEQAGIEQQKEDTAPVLRVVSTE